MKEIIMKEGIGRNEIEKRNEGIKWIKGNLRKGIG